MICPDCNGSGEVFRFVDGLDPKTGKSFGYSGMGTCWLCKGTRVVDDAYAARRRQGETMREARLATLRSVREEAERLGVTPSALSKVERGVMVMCAQCSLITEPENADFFEGDGMVPDRWFCRRCQVE